MRLIHWQVAGLLAENVTVIVSAAQTRVEGAVGEVVVVGEGDARTKSVLTMVSSTGAGEVISISL